MGTIENLEKKLEVTKVGHVTFKTLCKSTKSAIRVKEVHWTSTGPEFLAKR